MAISLTIFGATGGTGRLLTEQALQAGHQVTAVTRSGAGPLDRLADQNLTVARADVMDADAIRDLVTGRDAVVSAIGSRDGLAPTTACQDATASIISAMHKTGSRRLVVITASGMFRDGDTALIKLAKATIMGRLLREPWRDLLAADELTRRSGLDWTLIRPSRLTNGARTGKYRTSATANVRGGDSIARADVADLIVRVIADRATIGQAISIGN